jgi:hypothetical protein
MPTGGKLQAKSQTFGTNGSLAIVVVGSIHHQAMLAITYYGQPS